MTSDWENLARAKHGDEAAWKDLSCSHQKRLIKMAMLITGSVAAAKDIVQETFLYLVKSTTRHQSGSFKAYITTIAYHLALKEKKRLHSVTELGETDLSEQSPQPLETVLLTERDLHIAKTINSLSDDHRNVLILRFYGDHSYEDIAEITKQPIGTVKSRIFYAVKKCREVLKQKGII